MKKMALVYGMGVGLLVLLAVPRALPDTAADLKQADGLYQAGRYPQAEQICQSILQREPNNPQAVYQAGKLLPVLYLALDQPAQAQEATRQLLARSAGHDQLPHALHEIVEQARTLGRTPQAGQLYEALLAAQPAHPQALWLKMGVTLAQVYLGNDASVEAGVGDLIAHHSAEPGAGEALAQIGWAYDKLGQYGKSRPLYEYAVDHWPDKPRVVYAHTALVRDCIRLKDKPAAQTRLEQLRSRYAQDTHLPNVLNEIARGYREAQMYEEARPLSQYILDNYSSSDQCIWSQRDLVLCDIGLRNPEAAQARLQKLVTDYAKSGYLAYVLNEIARGYRETQMYERAKPISQYILDNYPASDQCIWAQRDLILCDARKGNQGAAQTGLQQLTSRYSENGYLPYVLNEIAGEYRQVRMYAQARTASEYVLDHFPNSDQCFWAQRDIVLSALASNDLEAAAVGTQNLLRRFAGQPGAILAIDEVARSYSNLGQHEQARDLFRFNLANSPASDDTIWSLRGLINESIARNDEAGIDAGIGRLLREYSTSKNLPMAALHVGRELGKAGRARAGELFQYVIDKHPGHEQALFAKVCLGHTRLWQGQDNEAEAMYARILSDYKDHPKLLEAVQLMAEGYFDRAVALEQENAKRVGSAMYAQVVREQGRPEAVRDYYLRAIGKWQTIIQKLPPTSYQAAQACYFVGVTYRRHLGDPEKALPFYEKVVEQWPNYEYAWSAQSMQALCYETLVHSGRIPKAEAEPKIEQAYQAVVEKYWDCALAPQAYLKLGLRNLNRGQWDQAALYLGQFLERYPQAKQWPYALVYLATTYEKRGQPEAAAELYRAYLGVADPDDPRVKMIQAKLEKEVEK